MDYKLSLFTEKNLLHLPDIRLKLHHHFFQMDSIIITSNVILILEAKHMKGTLAYYGAERQLVQKDGESEKGFKDPILQARTQAVHLQSWLRQAGWNIPVETLVVSTNQHAIIKNPDHHGDFTRQFVTLEDLPFKIKEIFTEFQTSRLRPAEQRKLAQMLIAHHIPARSSLIQQLRIQDHHLLSGVACPVCTSSPLQKISYSWHCTACTYQGKADYKRVILDYFLLHGADFISNQMCRDILQVQHAHTAYHLVNTMNLQTTGSNKGRKYLTPVLKDFPQHDSPRQFDFSLFAE